MMLRAAVVAAVTAAAGFTMAAPASAYAGFGAVAYDQETGNYGASWNASTQSKAFEEALKQCSSAGCKVHPVEPKGCGALAMSDKDKAWGGADREKLEEAKREAVAHCQTHTQQGTCAVRVSGCNN